QAMLDSFVELAGAKTPAKGTSTLRDSSLVQLHVGQSHARLDAARTYLLASLDETWTAVSATHEVTIEQRMRNRVASTHAVLEAREVASVIYHAAGSSAIFENAAFERRF